jgi:hypothetical protein
MIGPNGSNGITTAQLNQVDSAVEHLASLEDQDSALVIEMVQAMLGDLIEDGTLRPMADYVRRYCDVVGNAQEADQIAAEIAADL